MKEKRLENGRFKKGIHYSVQTEFKKGTHWRKPKPYWNKEWLYNEYIILNKPAVQIAKEQGCKNNNILYFIHKHQIKTRTMREIRKNKHWGNPGEKNPMFGLKGELNPNWKGGTTPIRQKLYETKDWKQLVRKIYIRDNIECQKCGLEHKYKMESFHLHHIKSFSLYPQLRLDPSNIVLLCRPCHNFIHSNKNTNHDFLKE